jgi:DNA (cytosine-5)-methyltransferase 1
MAPKAKNAPTVISLFAGVGGSSLGYSMAGFKELLAVEWDKDAAAIFKKNFPDIPVYRGDVSKLSVPEILRRTGLKKGKLNVLDGSPPCQGFSTSGKRQFDDSRNQLFRQYARLLKGLGPKAFVMENVGGMVKGKMRIIFAEIMRQLKACGYRVKCRLMDAAYFQVPQQRQRVIFIGIREDLKIEPSHPRAEAGPISTLDAIGNMPLGNPGKHEAHIIQAWHKVKCGKSLRTVDKHVDNLECIKLNPHKPSIAILTGHLHWHWKIARRLTIDEAAVMASFPTGFQWNGNKGVCIKGIGNCVPPMFMRAIANHVKNLIGS